MELRSKDSIRQMIWDHLETNDLAAFPRPVHHRIPNFKGAPAACDRLRSMEVFQKARTVKVNPDKPQQQARFLALEANKTLLVPTPRLKSGLFNRIAPPTGANKNMLKTCSSSQGVRQYSTPVGLDAGVKVDLVIIGSVAVSPKGYRVGKGEGYADMEFAMMSSMGAVGEDTVVITTVHDCQVLEDIPDHLFGEHDLGVDCILTPTKTIKCDNKRPRPKGIIWHLLTREKFSQIPILKILRKQEAAMGIDVRLREELDEAENVDSSSSNSNEFRNSPCLPYGRDSAGSAGMKSMNVSEQSQRTNESSRDSGQESNARRMEADGAQMTWRNETGAETRTEGQRSKGHGSASNRRRDLDGMFAWSKQGK